MAYTFTTLASPSSTANFQQYKGINSSGQIVGYYQDKSANAFGFVLNGSTYTSLTVPAAQGSPPITTKAFGAGHPGAYELIRAATVSLIEKAHLLPWQ